jgi:DNA modification methylase
MGLLLDTGTLVRWSVVQGDALEVLRTLPDEVAQCCITSPPYLGLRDYGVDGQIGLEKTPDEYVARLVEIFREVRRVLRSDGVLWLIMGDSYAGSWGNQGRKTERGTQRPINGEMISPVLDGRYPDPGSCTGAIPDGANYKAKDLLGVPWLLAFALRADGWYLRSDIIWAKPNPMPSSVRDRCTTAHEYVFMFAKKRRYYYDLDAIAEEAVGRNHHDLTGPAYKAPGQTQQNGSRHREEETVKTTRNKRDVWTIATVPFPDAHFAVFPPKLIEPMILAGTSPTACGVCGSPSRRMVERTKMEWREGPTRDEALASYQDGSANGRTSLRGTMTKPPVAETVGWGPSCSHNDLGGRSVVLDPFAGAGTTGLVSIGHGRDFIGIDLSGVFVEMARQRIHKGSPINSAPADIDHWVTA